MEAPLDVAELQPSTHVSVHLDPVRRIEGLRSYCSSQSIQSSARMSLTYGAGGATAALTVIGLCTWRSCLNMVRC